ncbi:hypothetical protein G6O67_007940 [Ophiocordyceps sinensis]|uniref:Uncharacterized protein n=1 Tax=Ophiocordyceps sinensis TaxID=72228 RepID=A0A8H4LSW1_9HYPO|nr:hypothetical protein G6O67_007940 [Ophiocordyceps sinensis]
MSSSALPFVSGYRNQMIFPSLVSQHTRGKGDYGWAYRGAKQVDGHEEEVDAASEVGDADGPDLGDDDAPDGAAGCGEVEAAGTNRRGEDLGLQGQPVRCFWTREGASLTSELYTQAAGPRPRL